MSTIVHLTVTKDFVFILVFFHLRLLFSLFIRSFFVFFFFQAEDGIRDYKVTGVQTCALPILEYFCCSTRMLQTGRLIQESLQRLLKRFYLTFNEEVSQLYIFL